MNITDPNILPWLIPVGPLLAFLIIVLITNRSHRVPATSHEYGGHHPDYDGMDVPVVTDFGRVASIIIGMSGIVAAWLISLNVVGQALGVGTGEFGKSTVFASSIEWLATGLGAFRMGVLVDPLTTIMLVMVPLACAMIFIYAIGYMAHDPRQARFFAFISLFAGAMLTLVVADNLLLLFVGWEVMGLCSYLLIGFWFEKHSAYKAAMKAFMTTRVADVIMLLGIAYLYASTGTLNFRDIMYNPAPPVEGAEHAAEEGEHSAAPSEIRLVLNNGGEIPAQEEHGEGEAAAEGEEGEHGEEAHTDTWANRLAATPAIILGGWGISAAGLIGMFLIIGTIGKSAQFPLHVWLPDAMEGPTPVSAMIHAAAMVSAGIYAIIRMYPLFEAGGNPHHGVYTAPLLLMSVIGAVTALFAATIAVAQNDVKKVLAYSTISQLGFMMAALGIGAYIAAAFHLITHAFFKALLFMASGAVIHGMEHGEHHAHEHAHEHDGHGDEHAHDEHDDKHGHADAHAKTDEQHGGQAFDPQDMLNMGGLRRTMPVTFYTFVAGGLALAGFPLITAGFWSKDEILADAWLGLSEGFGPQAFVFIMLAIAAFLTAFYTARQLCLVFLGEPRTEAAKYANLGAPAVSATMTLPLIILAFFAITAGFVGVPPDFPILGWIFSPQVNPFFEFVKYTLLPEIQPPKPPFNLIPVATSFLVALGGLWLGYRMYGRKPLEAGQPDPLVALLNRFSPGLHSTLQNKYYFDELYETLFIKPVQWFSTRVAAPIIDQGIIDGTLHLIARVSVFIGDFIKNLNMWLIDGVGDGVPELIQDFGVWFRRLQTGRVQQYLLLVAIAALIIGIIFAISTGILQAAGG
jgi:NADH:ubiquinone oxidoreductase subunit 5 (subunit L)/multisubunit Na+/H+ antiporter MnhA subunit